MKHNRPGVIACLGADRMEGEIKMPLGKGGDSKPAPETVGSRIHRGGFPGNRNPGLFSETDQVPHNPG